MADSGVDTGNESSDNTVFDHPHQVFEFSPPPIPINISGQPMPIDFLEEPHDQMGKIKFCTNARHCRLKYKNSLVYYPKNKKLRFAAGTNNTELVEKLLQAGADPNNTDKHLRSPLHLAACRGYAEVVKILIKYGANPNIKDTLGNTPLHLAACTSHIPVVIALLGAGTDVSSNDKNGRTPLQLAQSKLKLIQMKPGFHETQELISEIRLIVKMMLKYMKIQKADSGELESVCKRLENVSTREQVDSEVQNLLDSLDSLKLR
ncbi:unnamed protein product [Leptosia nina]|uniref:Ankyrin repeat domain-containing protein 54 n=1 Tax=Leptosia nina TaxID=320188 RepID=A0AAV1J9N3_9NEOP